MAGLEIAELKYVDDIATNYVLDEQYEGKTINASTDMQLEIGSGITLVVGRNSEQSTVEIPKLIGLSLADAKSRLWDRGLNVGGVRFEDGINLLNRKKMPEFSRNHPHTAIIPPLAPASRLRCRSTKRKSRKTPKARTEKPKR
ncbi:MAG: hypothetical protein L6V35_09200 [Alistipes putredinis]|nr:MAG: hypothetical protein L6V35_09200 [Alistipes putredinis]